MAQTSQTNIIRQDSPAAGQICVVLSGMRPTGELHLGHYFGALHSWLYLQTHAKRSFFMVADLHALTTLDDVAGIAASTEEMVRDWLAVGIDPDRSVIFRQSDVPAHAELALLLAMHTPLSWLERNPTYKEMAAEYPDHLNLGLLSYPVLQTADIALYGADAVPVGEDQLPHLELGREIIRRINQRFKTQLVEPKAFLQPTARVLGLDGQAKMSKHLDNFIALADTPDIIQKKLRKVQTDVGTEKGRTTKSPTVNALFLLLQLFDPGALARFEADYQGGTIRYGELKDHLAQAIAAKLAPIRDARSKQTSRAIHDLLASGAQRAHDVANATLKQVKRAMGLG